MKSKICWMNPLLFHEPDIYRNAIYSLNQTVTNMDQWSYNRYKQHVVVHMFGGYRKGPIIARSHLVWLFFESIIFSVCSDLWIACPRPFGKTESKTEWLTKFAVEPCSGHWCFGDAGLLCCRPAKILYRADLQVNMPGWLTKFAWKVVVFFLYGMLGTNPHAPLADSEK